MVKGVFIGSDKPTVKAVIAWDQAIQAPNFILDTGFTGDLVVSEKIATDLGLSVDGVMKVSLAGSELVQRPTASAIAVMEKFGYKAIIDCKNKKVSLEVV